MERRERILAGIDAAFSEPPPDWIGPEFQSKTVDLVRRWITGEAAGDPFLFMDAAGFKHFVPALARLAYGTGPDFVLDRVLHYLTRERLAAFSEEQRAAVEALLADLADRMRAGLDARQAERLDCALRRIHGEPCPSDREWDRILAEIAAAFAVPRPDWFVDATHCCECAEHEAELQAETVDTLHREVMGDGGWDPVVFITNPDGFKYFLPALARIAYGTGPDYFLGSFLTYFNADHVDAFSERQRAAVEALLLHLGEVLGPEIDAGYDRDTFNWALGRIRGEPGPRSWHEFYEARGGILA
jgi:hypothetical protein